MRLHRVLGLALGGWFALLGLTGSALVYYLEIDGWLRPQHRVQLTAATPPVDPDAVLGRLRTLHPRREGPWRIELPRTPQQPVRARYLNPVEREGQAFAPLLVVLHPQSLEVLSEGFWGDDPMTWIYDLHYALRMGASGRTAVGIVGLAMLLALIAGGALWWSARRARWHSLLPRWRPGSARRVYDLHVLCGAYAAVFLLVLCVTGAALALPGPTHSLLARFSSVSSTDAPQLARRTGIGESTAPVSLAAAVRLGLEALGGGEVRWIESSDAKAATPIVLRVHLEGDPGHRFPHARVWLHPTTGAVLRTLDARQGGAADRVLAWLHPLHNGEAFGTLGRGVVLLAGLAPAVLLLTGVLRWIRKRSARARLAATGVDRALPHGPANRRKTASRFRR